MRTRYSPRTQIPKAFNALKKLPTKTADVQPGRATPVNSLQKSPQQLNPTNRAAATAPITRKIISGNAENENSAVVASRIRPPSETRGESS